MTTVKSILKIVMILAIACAAFTCFQSCKADSENDTLSRLESLKSADGDDVICCYRVIIPSSASSELVNTVRVLSSEITERMGVDCCVIYDNEYTPRNETCFDILVGNTNRSETVSALDGLLRDDYICKMTDEYLILGARSDSAAIKVVERFVDEVLPLCEGQRITDYESDFEYHHDYEIDSLFLCGFDIRDYGIVCTFSRESAEASAVYRLRELIADRCGAYSDIRFGESQRNGVKEIAFRIDESKNGYAVIDHNGEDVEVVAAESYGLSVGLEKFYSKLFENPSDGRADLDIVYSMSYPYHFPKIELVTLITDISSGANVINDALEFADSIPTSADVAMLGKLNKEVSDLVKNNLKNGLNMKTVALDDDTVVAFVYKQALFNVGDIVSKNIASVREFSIELQFASGGQRLLLYTYIEQSADDRNGAVESLKNNLKIAEDFAVATYICADDTLLEITGERVSTCHNISLSVGADSTRVGVFATDNGFDCRSSGSHEIDKGYALAVRVQKRFCDAFIALG